MADKKMVKIFSAILIILIIWVVYRCYTSCSKAVKATYYYDPNCPYCSDFNAVWDRFADESDYEVVKVNCADPQESYQCEKAMANGMTGYPHVVFEKDGVENVYNNPRTLPALHSYVNYI